MYLPLTASPQPSSSQPPSGGRSRTQRIVTVCLLAILVALPVAAWGATSAPVVAVAAVGPVASNKHVPVAVLSGSSDDGVCEKHTGGTCFFAQCAAARKAVCSHTWSKFQWHECDCDEGLCAGIDGMCHDRPFPWTIESWFRKESYSLFFLMILVVGRSGLYAFLLEKTGLDRVTTVREKIATTFLTKDNKPQCGLTPFDDLVGEQKLTTVQVVIVCTVKLLLWHVAQVLFFWSAWFAYRQFMGPCQFFFATVVAAKEAAYMLVLVAGVVEAPHFLLYAPFSAPAGRALYFLSPCLFVAHVLCRLPPGKVWRNLVLLPTFLLELAGPPSAWIALVVGLCGQGVMFPSLFFGYLLTGVSWLGIILWVNVEKDRL